MAFIRGYRETDFDACARICIATLPPSLASSPEAARLSPYLWTHPYTHLSSATCHVLDDGDGVAVGYCIGCPDVHAFVSAYASYADAVLSRAVARPSQLSTREPWTIIAPADGDSTPTTTTSTTIVNPLALAQLAYRADWMLLGGREAVAGRWRATMHIDVLEPWQRKGWGRKLIGRFVQSVRESGADYGEGEHIGVAGDNRKVVEFYEKLGFRVVEAEKDGGSICLVKDIEKG